MYFISFGQIVIKKVALKPKKTSFVKKTSLSERNVIKSIKLNLMFEVNLYKHEKNQLIYSNFLLFNF